MRTQRGESLLSLIALIAVALFLVFGGVGGCMWGYPKYRVYSQEMAGKALLAEAESSRQVAVLEAKAKLDSAKNLAGAEVERAKGVAQANKIIGDSLHNNEDYLRYLFVNGLENTKNQVIYVPTETNLPILEASRNQRPAVTPAKD
jgi:regulator of protease activity HflC (stomatin/prohibitin superfamily)